MAGKQQPEQGQDQDSGALSFEESFRRLEQMAESLEAGGLTLAEATVRYEQGMTLVRRCNQLLDETELKITTLKEAYQTPLTGGEPDQNEDQDDDEEA